MKKFLLLFTAAACVGLASCSETLSAEDKKLEEIQKKFDFSEVDIENIQDIREETKFSTSDLTVFTGTIDDCAWIGVFDSQSGSLKCQYTDVDHPTSYFAYGEEYEYRAGSVLGIYFEGNDIAIAIQYPKYESTKARLDLIAFDKNNKVSRTTIAEEIYSDTGMFRFAQWTNNTICFCDQGGYMASIYDINKNEVLCFSSNADLFYAVRTKLYPEITGDIFISNTDLLHFWHISYPTDNTTLWIIECQCTYDAVAATKKNIKLFDTYTGDSSKAPHYSFKYQTRTDDHISAVITQTEYDGTVTTKIVDIRLENDELKIEIQ